MTKLQQQSARFFAIGVIVLFYSMSQLPTLPQSERDALAADFGFSSTQLAEPEGLPQQTLRTVHPELERIVSWLSAMGASVALNDLDGDGLPNDICHVDPRFDEVIISPAPEISPETSLRYAPFVLTQDGLDFDPVTMAPIGCAPADMNEDGKMDLLVTYWGRTPIAYLNRSGPGIEPLDAGSYTAQEIAPQPALWSSSAATVADLDGDGHSDLIVTNYFQDDRTILDRTLDNPIRMHQSWSHATNAGGTYIFLWESASSGPNPAVHYRMVADALSTEMAHAWTLAIGAADLDGDLLPELYFANDHGPDRLLHNRSTPGQLSFAALDGEKFLTTPKSRVLGRDSFKGMGVDFGDLNGDGLFDIYVSNIADDYALHESHFMWLSTGDTELMADGVAPYNDAGEELGVSRSSWGWESRLADFNNDGVLEAVQATGFIQGDVDRWPDLQELAIGSDDLIMYPQSWPKFQPGSDISGHDHNPFYVRAADGRFYDLAAELGIDDPYVSRGLATADVDGDGDLDFAIANQWEPSVFFQNDCPGCGTFLGIHLLLPVEVGNGLLVRSGHPAADTLGYPAVGATATVRLPDSRRLVNLVDGGNGQAGARSSDLHFGLDDHPADSALDVEIRWRDSAGEVREETLSLTPGWHTVVLGE